VADSPYLPAESVTVEREPVVGYLMVLAAAALFAVNGTVSKVALESGITPLRLTEARCTGAFVCLAALVLATRPWAMRTSRRELLFLACYGVGGVAFVQVAYFFAIERLPIGISLLIQYLAPVLVALWARFVMHEHVRRRVWTALALALVGLAIMVDVSSGISLDGLGVAFSLVAAVAFALSLLLAEHAVGRRDPLSLLAFGFFFATVFWTLMQPWWSFPFESLVRTVSLLGNLEGASLPAWSLVLWVVVLGTTVPFLLMVGSLRHLPATRVGIIAMLEPVLGALVAYVWLDEELAAQQLTGGAVVLAAIFLAQTSR
jgi:drug/metabolite transporter (DMT)-like permease